MGEIPIPIELGVTLTRVNLVPGRQIQGFTIQAVNTEKEKMLLIDFKILKLSLTPRDFGDSGNLDFLAEELGPLVRTEEVLLPHGSLCLSKAHRAGEPNRSQHILGKLVTTAFNDFLSHSFS